MQQGDGDSTTAAESQKHEIGSHLGSKIDCRLSQLNRADVTFAPDMTSHVVTGRREGAARWEDVMEISICGDGCILLIVLAHLQYIVDKYRDDRRHTHMQTFPVTRMNRKRQIKPFV